MKNGDKICRGWTSLEKLLSSRRYSQQNAVCRGTFKELFLEKYFRGRG